VAESTKEEIRALVEVKHLIPILLRSLRPIRHNGLFLKVRAARAYELARTNMSWNDIADTLGYSDRTAVCRAARNYAAKNNLAWPLRTVGQGEQDN
jgi:hypothetical protein